jgi:hypothetical protein
MTVMTVVVNDKGLVDSNKAIRLAAGKFQAVKDSKNYSRITEIKSQIAANTINATHARNKKAATSSAK